MKNHASLLLACATIAAAAHAGEISHETETSYNVSGSARSNLGNSRSGGVSEQNAHFQHVVTYSSPGQVVLRGGIAYDRLDFGVPDGALIPDTLQSAYLIAGVDFQVSDLLVRLELQPGLYGDLRRTGTRDLNMPVVLGISWLVNKDLQWIAGLSFDANRSQPVLGGIGVRWSFAPAWVLNFVPPNPRLEYKATDNLTLFGGGRFVASTFRMTDRFGTAVGDPRYNRAVVFYSEIRVGGGFSWKINPSASLEMELGYMAYRSFDFQRVDEDFETKIGAIYGQAGLSFRF